MIFVGMILGTITWLVIRREIYFPFPYAVVGSVTWSIVSWQILVHQSIVGDRRDITGRTLSAISCTQGWLVFCIPIALSVIVGIVHATTNSIDFSDRFYDFALVLLLGSITGVLLALPVFCLSLLRRKRCHDQCHSPNRSSKPTRMK
jgi:hypothetical protein